MPDHSGGISGNNSVRLYIVRNDTAGSDHRILTDGNTRKNGVAPAPIHARRQICTGLQVITDLFSKSWLLDIS